MERKIFQHLLELKSLQIRSCKSNEALLVSAEHCSVLKDACENFMIIFFRFFRWNVPLTITINQLTTWALKLAAHWINIRCGTTRSRILNYSCMRRWRACRSREHSISRTFLKCIERFVHIWAALRDGNRFIGQFYVCLFVWIARDSFMKWCYMNRRAQRMFWLRAEIIFTNRASIMVMSFWRT